MVGDCTKAIMYKICDASDGGLDESKWLGEDAKVTTASIVDETGSRI